MSPRAHDYESAGQAADRLGRPGRQGRPGRRAGQRRLGSAGRLRGRRRRAPRAPRPSGCWPSWPAKTSSKTTTAPGGSPSGWPRTGSSRSSIPRPATCTSPVRSIATATRPTSPSSPRPGWSLPPPSPRPTPPTARPASSSWTHEEPGLQVLGDGAYGSARPWRTATGQAPPGHQALADARHLPVASIATTSWSTSRPGPPPVPAGHTVTITPDGPPSSGATAADVRFATGAPRPRTVASSHSPLTTPNSSNPVGHGVTATSPTTTDDCDRWSSALSPGW